MMPMFGDKETKTVKLFLVSDFTGETAEYVAKAAASQFGLDTGCMTHFRYVNDDDKVSDVVKKAQENNAVVICTVVDQDVRRGLLVRAGEAGLNLIDLLGPITDAIAKKLDRPPMGTPGLLRRMDESYFKRVKAVEYTIKCDDGKSPEYMDEADLVILGVSRTSKTPLSMYLANKGLKVSNQPLVPESDPPEEIYSVPSDKVVGLKVSAEKLVSIRRERLRVLGLGADVSTYAQWERVQEELDFATNIMRKVGCKVIEVTNRAIEETAQEILDYLDMIHKQKNPGTEEDAFIKGDF